MLHGPKTERALKELLLRDHTLLGGLLFGIEGHSVEVQARATGVLKRPDSWRGAASIAGMTKGATKEVLARISGAFSKLQIPDPHVSILINLAPADLEKNGTWLDLPIAIILLQAAGMLPDLPEEREGRYVLIGEIGIHGEIRRVPGALSIAYQAKPGQRLIIPAGNEKECALILAKPGHEGCGVFPVRTLQQVIEFFNGGKPLENALSQTIRFDNAIPKAIDFGKIKGQERAKRAAVISAAGGHNLLLIGPPGEGKSLLAKAMPGILPRLSDPEKVELTKIYSACGLLEKDGMAVTRRPMRHVHHTASQSSLIGGGSGVPRPGEVTLAHLGILFLDEIAEFSRSTLEVLRQPIEDGCVTINRVHASLTFPSQFTLVAAMNPCPCGYFGNERCSCSPKEIKAYQQRLSGPLLDRIDLQVELQSLTFDERFAKITDDASPRLRAEVEAARQMQRARFGREAIPFNAAIPGGSVADYVDFSPDGLDAYRRLVDGSQLSTRSMDRLAKVARTIADLSRSRTTNSPHVDEAATFVIGGMLREA